MAKIIEIQHLVNKGSYAVAHVLLDDGTEAQVYIGGSVEAYLDRGVIKAFVKKKA